MRWLQENWFKIGILIVSIAFVSVYYLINIKTSQSSISNQQTGTNALITTATTSIAISNPAEPAAMVATSTSNSIKSPVVKAQTLPNAESKSPSNEITQDEVAPFKKAIFKIICFKNGELNSTGSGFAMDMPGAGKVIITNKHVIDGDECDIHDNSDRAIWNLDITNLKSWNRLTDQAIAKITATQYPPYPLSDIPTINAISKITNCPLKMPTDSQVIVMGYPGSTGGFRPMALQSLTVTRGIISAYSSPILGATSNDDALALESLPDQNYYVDAQIDSGNSGGLALSKSNGSLCLLGIPTWVSLTGHFQAPGIVQSMNNIMYGK